MQKRNRTKPAPKPETITPAAAPEPKAALDNEQRATQDGVLLEFVNEIMHDLAMNEGRAGQVARRALRVKRDGTKLTDSENAEVKALLAAIAEGYQRASDANTFKPDGQGHEIFNFDLPPELQDGPELPSAPPAEVPEWVNDTPRDMDYTIYMSEPHAGSIEEIDLTRAEYITLKAHLAAMRGYVEKAA